MARWKASQCPSPLQAPARRCPIASSSCLRWQTRPKRPRKCSMAGSLMATTLLQSLWLRRTLSALPRGSGHQWTYQSQSRARLPCRPLLVPALLPSPFIAVHVPSLLRCIMIQQTLARPCIGAIGRAWRYITMHGPHVLSSTTSDADAKNCSARPPPTHLLGHQTAGDRLSWQCNYCVTLAAQHSTVQHS